ncbi:dedicator of cytokinesis protein 7-like [Nematostella vectensis]|uniref:dedicator of cytokinesis protein 7-like n=1 Tax=Nematostella vectensis TaxID=45351 RepID=UPI002076EDB4|nr:dedicator of cytokinesis protein 7-like [Nematostella vectensis]
MAATGSSSSATRAFAQKLNKNKPAAEVRRNVVSSVFVSQASKRSSTIDESFLHLASGTVPLSEVVNPLDFEEFVLQNQPLNDNEPDAHMFDFPDDDIEVTTTPRHCRTVQPTIPKDISLDSDPHLKDCVHTYQADWSIVNRRYQFRSAEEDKPDSRRRINRSRSFINTLPKQIYESDEKVKDDQKSNQEKSQDGGSKQQEDAPKGSWASSIFDLQSSQADEQLPTLLNHTPAEEIDQDNYDQRQLQRIHSVFSVFPAQQEEGIEKRVPPTIPQQHFGQRILVKCLQLKLDLEVEPIFASMALYDLRVKKKISENFYFDMNNEWCRKLLKDEKRDISTLSRSAIFSITYPSTDVFLVIKLEKVLQQGDISECAEPYLKDTDNAKHRDKVRAVAVANCERLGQYRMPFAWTAIHLIDIISGTVTAGEPSTPQEREGSAANNPNRKSSTIETPPTSKTTKRKDAESLPRSYNAMIEQRKSFHGSHLTHVGDSLDFDVLPDLSNFRPVTLSVSSFFKQESDRLKDEDLYKFLADLKRPTSVLKRLKCIPGVIKLDISPPGENPPYCLTSSLHQVHPYPDGQGRPTKEIEEFAPREVFSPFVIYENLLYIYPQSVNFSSRGTSARNIACKVQIMSGEDEQNCIECIFGKSSCASMSKEAYTHVTYHNRTPDFNEEIKVKCPAHLTDQHHILFTFYHISCSPGKKPDEKEVETPIGYTWIPMLKDGRLALGEFNLPVSLDKPPHSYSMLSPEVQLPGMKWVEGHKGVFHVAVRAVSSIHTQDPYIHKFLKMCHQIEGRMLSPSRNAEGNLEMVLRKSIVDLSKAREEPLVRFLHIIMDKLILLLVRPPVISGTVVNIGQAAFESLAQIVNRLHLLLENNQDDHNRNDLLASYVTFVFSAPYTLSPTATPELYPGDGFSRISASSLHAPHTKLTMSSSNPQLNAAAADDERQGGNGGWEEERRRSGRDKSNLPGNRSSMAEGRVGSINVPGMPSSNSKKLVHEEIALQWAVASGPVREMAMKHAWFFFEVMIKSMAQHLDNTDKFFWPRKTRFPDQFLGDLRALVNTTVQEIVNKQNDFAVVQDLNSSLGFFLYDLLSFIDRGFVFELLKNYCKEMLYQGSLHSSLGQLRLELLRIVCSHEHYVTLNLPYPTSLYPSEPSSPTTSLSSLSSTTSGDTLTPGSSMAELSVAFRQQHFLVGLLLSELAMALEGCDFNLQSQAIDTIRDLLACHDSDTRFDDPVCRRRVAALYLPLLGVVIDARTQLHGYRAEETSGLNPDVAMAIATSSVASQWYESRPELGTQLSRAQQLSPESTRNLLMGFLWVLKNMDPTVLVQWWTDQDSSRLGLLLDVLHLCITQFEYTGRKEVRNKNASTAPRSKTLGDAKATLEEMFKGEKSAARQMMERHSRAFGQERGASPAAEPKLRWRKEQTQWRPNSSVQEKSGQEADVIASHIEGGLCAEINMVVLDTLELIVKTVSKSESLRVILSGVLRVLLHCLSSNQSKRTLQNMFNTQRSIVYKFPELLFEEDTELCADLCNRLLNHCSSSIGAIRAQASASLYLLMRQNFEIGNNFARVKMQVTMSLSTLVGTSHVFSEECLRRSLKTIITYAESDHELKNTTFPEQVRELVFNLHMILSDTVKMKEFQEDPEMLVDLMYRIAKGYQNSPDLRLTWLHNMAAKHGELKNDVEAALCIVHAAALVSEYLSMMEDKRFLPVGCVAFEKISPNVLEESAVSDDVVSPDEEGICTGKYFSENGLIGLLEQAAIKFMDAQMFECTNEVYKLLIPILEARREYDKLAMVHSKISEAFKKIIQTEGKRMMGTYFRVGFYGSKFGDLDGEEYVYKEPAITKLPEISHRLQAFYGDKFGEEFVEVIKDSNAVDRDKLDPNLAYIQLTYVEPFFDEYEMKDRKTYFDKNYNLRRFLYVTPFTPSGKARGDLCNQYKRKTILTVANSFPYLKTRVSVMHREQIVLSPIEVAIEDMQNRTHELYNAIYSHSPDAKMLQMVLQGSIGTTVNQGPLEIAIVFLHSDTNADDEPDLEPQVFNRHHHKLRLSFKEFMKRCGDALHVNKQLIKSDQRAYQKELERNYHKLMEQLEPLLRNKFGSLRGSMRKKEGSALLRKISMSFNASHSVA